MAPPPKPPSPPASASASDSKSKKKVTPLQVAFLVERYLADNGFAASLAAFRSDAAHLFARTSANVVPPKGLLPLADILHDYVSLKESRLAVDSAMHAMQTLVSTYYLHNPLSNPSTPALPPPSSPPLVPPFFVGPSTSSPPQQHHPPMPPHPGTIGYNSPIIHYTQKTSSSVVVHNSSDANNISTPAASSLHTKKRKATKSATKTASASKKACTAPATSSQPKGKNVASQLPIGNPEQNMGSAARPSSAEHSMIPKLPIQGSSVAKSLFKPLQSQLHSSPCTPQQSHPMGDEPASYQMQRPSVVPNAHAQQDIVSSQCSIVSSKTLIVSPLKGGTYYSVERSYHVSSPLKSSTQKSSKREHVKGKLNFDSSDAMQGPTEHICENTSTSTSSDGEKQDDIDIDFTNFDVFDGEFSFSELLLDFDLDNEGVPCEDPFANAEAQRLEPIPQSNHVTADPFFQETMKPLAAGPTEDINSQGATSITSVRAISKRIKIVSPVKDRAASQCSK